MKEVAIYRGITIKQGQSGRYYLYRDSKEIYSMTSAEEEVYGWIDAQIRTARAADIAQRRKEWNTLPDEDGR